MSPLLKHQKVVVEGEMTFYMDYAKGVTDTFFSCFFSLPSIDKGFYWEYKMENKMQ